MGGCKRWRRSTLRSDGSFASVPKSVSTGSNWPRPFAEKEGTAIFLVTHEQFERIVIMRTRASSSFLAVALMMLSRLSIEGAMSSAEVQTIISQAASVARTFSPRSVIAVTDHEGFVLGVWTLQTNPSPATVANAIAKAGTAAYLSSDQHGFTTRTAG